MADQSTLVSAFIRAANLQSRTAVPAKTATEILQSVLLGRFQSEGKNGRTILKVDEAGGSVEFTIPENMGAADIMALAELALQRIEGSVVKRLRADFSGVLT